MKSWYVDTSILDAYYCPEPVSTRAERFLGGVDEPVISILTEVELFSLVAKKRRRKDFGEVSARKILMEFQSHLEEGYYRKTVLGTDHWYLAREMIAEFKTSLRTLDALHLAVASREGLPMVTADSVLAASGRRYGVEIRLIKAPAA